MVDPKQTAGYKFERRNGNTDEGGRLGQRLKNRFTMCFTSPSPPPSLPQRKPKSRSRTPMVFSDKFIPLKIKCVFKRESEYCHEGVSSFTSRLRDERIDLESLECNPINFKAVIKEYQQLRRHHDQLSKELYLMERNAADITTKCCAVLHENNKKLRQTLESSTLLDQVVKDMKSQLDMKDNLIRELQSERYRGSTSNNNMED